VYGGTFESFWYDMWATTGNAGWSLPQSATVATWLGVAGVVVIVIGLVIAISPAILGHHSTRQIPLAALTISCAASLFFGVWSAQPSYWAGVGPTGPSELPVFRSVNAPVSLPIRYGRKVDAIEVTRELWPLLGQSVPEAHVSLAIRIKSLEIPTGVGYPRSISGRFSLSLHALPVGSNVKSLWVEILVGPRSGTTSCSVSAGSLPVLVSEGQELRASNASCPIAGWVALIYNLPVPVDLHGQPVTLRLKGNRDILWNGSRSRRWLAVGVHSMTLPISIDGRSFDTPISASPPPPADPAQELGVATGLPVRQHLTVHFPTGSPEDPILDGASLSLPLSVPVDKRTGPTLLVLIGLAYMALIIGAGSLGSKIRSPQGSLR
jgi:hypothetical protein